MLVCLNNADDKHSKPKPNTKTQLKKPSLNCFSFSFYFLFSASLRTNKHSKPRSPNTSPNTPLHSRWPSRKPPLEDPPRKIAQPYTKEEKTGFFTKDKGQNAIERIVLRLGNLGLGVEEGEGVEEGDDGIAAGDFKDLNMVVVNSSSGLAANLYLQSGNFMQKATKAQAKKLRAERLLAKIEVSMVPSGPDYDQETITDEERAMFRRVGLRMKAYLPLGIRGVFDGFIENMHLHWKYRELVKLISKQKTLAFVEDTARLLEYESGGILVAIERVVEYAQLNACLLCYFRLNIYF